MTCLILTSTVMPPELTGGEHTQVVITVVVCVVVVLIRRLRRIVIDFGHGDRRA